MTARRTVLFAGAITHVTVHSLDDLRLLETPAEFERCLWKVYVALARHEVECHAYCLMSNHLHLLLRTPHGGLAEAMQQLNSNLARGYNRAHRRRGPVLVAPYDARLVETDAYLLQVARYVVLNPVLAGMRDDPAGWPWSSYRATAGLAPRPRFLMTDWLLGRLGGTAGYRRFVAEGSPAATLDGLLLAA